MTPRGRRWRRVLVVLLVVCAVVWFGSGPVLRRVVRWRLQALVADELNARFDIGHLSYTYPYGVVVTDASLVTQTPEGQPLELLGIGRLDLQLAKPPFGKGPLVVQSLVIENPSIHLIHTQDGIVGRKSLVKPGDEVSPDISSLDSQRAKWKLSDIFQLTHLGLQGGQAIYEDRTTPDAAPLVWKNLNVNLDTKKDATGSYAFKLAVDNAPLATLDASGSANLDDLILKIESCALTVGVDPNMKESALPAALQTPLRKWDARGSLSLNLSGTAPLHDLKSSVYRCSLEMNSASGRVPGWNTTLDSLTFKIIADGVPHGRPTVRIDNFAAVANDARFRLQNVVATADPATMTWQLSGMRGEIDPGRTRRAVPPQWRDAIQKLQLGGWLEFVIDANGPIGSRDLRQYAGTLTLIPHDLTFVPPTLDQPLSGMDTMTLTLDKGKVTMAGVRGTCGDNLLFIKQGRVDLTDWPQKVRAEDLAGALTLGASHDYPPAVAPALDLVNPVGPFFFHGFTSVDLSQPTVKLDYALQIHTARGRLTLKNPQLEIGSINTDIAVTPQRAVISKFQAATLDGTVSATGSVGLQDKMNAAIQADCRNIDLARLAALLAKPGEKPSPLSGRGVLTVDMTAPLADPSTPIEKGLAGSGEFEIRNGNFWQIPMMKSIAKAMSKDSVTFGEAAGQFHIADGTIHFDRAVASAPILGVEGSGDVTFDGHLNFKGIADPLGNWSERVGDTGDGGVLAGVAATVQHGLNVATSHALYDVVVTGTTSDPHTTAVLAPFVTTKIQGLLSSARTESGGLLATLHKQNESPTTSPSAQGP